MLHGREDMEARLSKIRAKEKAQRQQFLRGESASKKRKPDSHQRADADQDEADEQFVLADYESDDGNASSKTGGATGLSAATLELIEKLGMNLAAPKEEDEEGEEELKVINLSMIPDPSDLSRYSTVLELIRSSPSSLMNSAE
jgi:chromosome transmission fidelity protein 1